MKALTSLVVLIVCIVLVVNYWNKDEPTVPVVQKKEDSPPVQQKTIQEVLKETQKKIATIKGYHFTRVILEKSGGKVTTDTTENGEEQLNPQIAHFMNQSNIEYYYDTQTAYRKVNHQWQKKTNPDGKVLVSVSFTNNVDFLLQNIGTSTPPAGINMTQNANGDYVISIDYLVFKDPASTEQEFQDQKLKVKKRTTTLTINGKTFEPMKYDYQFETFDGSELRSANMDLSRYDQPISIPYDVSGNSSAA